MQMTLHSACANIFAVTRSRTSPIRAGRIVGRVLQRFNGHLCGLEKPWGNPPKAEGAKPLFDRRQTTGNFAERKLDMHRQYLS